MSSGPQARATTVSLGDRPKPLAALDREFLDFATRSNRGAPGESGFSSRMDASVVASEPHTLAPDELQASRVTPR